MDTWEKILQGGRAGPRRIVGTWVVVLTSIMLLTGLNGQAKAAFGIASFDGSVAADASGNVTFTQAAGHPDGVSVSFAINTHTDEVYGDDWPDEPIKDVLVDLPPGLLANPSAPAQCTLDQLVGSTGNAGITDCPPASQIGMTTTRFPYCFGVVLCNPLFTLSVPLFNLTPPAAAPAQFGFNVFGTVVTLNAELRTGDYGAVIHVKDTSEGVPVVASTVTVWGVPADPSHDIQRDCPGQAFGTGGCRAGVPRTAFITLPTSCTGPATTKLHIDSWFHPGDFKTAEFVSHQTAAEGGAPQGTTGCDQVPFDPTFTAQPDERVSPGPSGWSFDLRIPQENIDDPDGIVQSHLKKASVTLPEGVRVSPSAADGLEGCSSSQIKLKSNVDPACPDASKVGELSIETPLLEDPLEGSVYLAKPHDNPSDSLLGLYLVAQGHGVTIKLAGSASPDPDTGQLTATFDDNPQLPFSHLHLHFFGGSRASLSNPPRCGTYTTRAVLTSWSGKTVETSDRFTTSHDGHGAPCPGSHFKPEFSAGTSSAAGQTPDGGSFSSFVMNLSRTDDDEEFGAIKAVRLPDGLLARVADVPL